jgi:hypothetical protein
MSQREPGQFLMENCRVFKIFQKCESFHVKLKFFSKCQILLASSVSFMVQVKNKTGFMYCVPQ